MALLQSTLRLHWLSVLISTVTIPDRRIPWTLHLGEPQLHRDRVVYTLTCVMFSGS